MRVVPVIDLKHGAVVRGVAGKRAQYQPLRSALTSDTSPAGVAAAFAALPAVEEIYVADLDAIGGAPPNEAVLAQIAACGLKLWFDAGLRDADSACRLLETAAGGSLAGLIVAMETAPSLKALSEILAAAGGERCILSLDLKSGRPLTNAACWTNRSALQIAAEAAAFGFRRLIVLDLASVGTYDGGSQLELCAAIGAAHPNMEIISGGGVRSLDDVQRFAAVGCSAVLAASALHDRRLSADDLIAAGEF